MFVFYFCILLLYCLVLIYCIIVVRVISTLKVVVWPLVDNMWTTFGPRFDTMWTASGALLDILHMSWGVLNTLEISERRPEVPWYFEKSSGGHVHCKLLCQGRHPSPPSGGRRGVGGLDPSKRPGRVPRPPPLVAPPSGAPPKELVRGRGDLGAKAIPFFAL